MIHAKDRRLYQLALRIALLSDCDDKHGAVFAIGSRVYAVAENTSASSRGADATRHAEQRVVGRRDPERPEGTVYSARLHDNPISAPCVSCQNAMVDAKIKRCVFHDGAQLQELFLSR
jgi:tRNA(Arg) A34 adenosine deaminase TadA